MPTPAFFASADEARLARAPRCRARPDVARALADAATADIVLVSPGTADPETSSLIIGGGMTREQMLAARSAGAIGNIVGQFFNASGAPVSNDLDARMVRNSMDQLRAAHVIAISVGRDKVASIRAAARGGLIKALITDQYTARELLDSA
jgi:DNA-binding transcriptional regulator LsrR (DeoR family)